MSGGEPPSTPADLARTLREAADRLMSGWTAALTGPPTSDTRAGGPDAAPTEGSGSGSPALPDVTALLGSLTPPATLSARQLQSVLDDLAARRAQVQALRAQLGVFDEQLAALEASLGPVLEWTRAWAGLEQTMTPPWFPPQR